MSPPTHPQNVQQHPAPGLIEGGEWLAQYAADYSSTSADSHNMYDATQTTLAVSNREYNRKACVHPDPQPRKRAREAPETTAAGNGKRRSYCGQESAQEIKGSQQSLRRTRTRTSGGDAVNRAP
ncbi:hypothetical protein Emed_007501 [Eimeria media]